MFRARRYLILLFLMTFLLFLLGRLFYLQIVGFHRFTDMAAEQHNRVIKVEPRRGAIYDRNMEPLAISLDTPSVYADPRLVKDKETAATLLSETLDVDREMLAERLNRDKAFVWVKRRVDEDTARKVKKLGLKGVAFVYESKRHYPNDDMATHVIGFAGIDNTGLEGIELKYDEKLKGEPGWKYLIRDAKRRTVLYNERDSIPPRNGYNIVLTIDSVVQFIVEEELERMVSSSKAGGATAIVMDPSSGEILAMANYPDYDPNRVSEIPGEYVKNPAISSVFEPGSVFKIVTASAALSEKRFDSGDRIYCEDGKHRIGGRILHDFHRFKDLSFSEVISKSSNIGTVKVAMELGDDTLYEYIRRFGFGEKTGIDLPGEVRGISRHPGRWFRSDRTTIPIGQGVAVTPIQLACAISVIANGGFLVKPQVVDWIATWEGKPYSRRETVVKTRVLNEKTTEKMKDILRETVTAGTGRFARSDLYATCGKTGTAQMVNPEGGYYENKYNATFIGFAPKEEPVVSVVVIARDPRVTHFGGTVAAPAFKNIVERTIQYLESGKDE